MVNPESKNGFEEKFMPITLQEFAGECHAFLKADPGPKGREKVRRRLGTA